MSKILPILLWAMIGLGACASAYLNVGRSNAWAKQPTISKPNDSQADGPIAAPAADLGSDDNPVAVAASPGAMAVDGEPGKWKKIKGLPAPYSNKDEGSLKLAWRDDGLHGLVQVKDDNIQSNSDTPWTADCLELWLESDDAKADGTSVNSTQLVLAPDPQNGAGKAIIGIPSGGMGPDAVKAMWKATADGYAIEFFIPARELTPATMQPGTKIGFNYSIDQQGAPVEQFYCEKNTDYSYKTPRNWGTIQLTAGSDQPVQGHHDDGAPPTSPASRPASAGESSVNVNPAEGMILYDVRDVDATLNLARQAERHKDWDQAALRYQQLLVQSGSRAFPATFDEEGRAVAYGNFGQYLQGCIVRWPIDGLASYREKFDMPASTLLESAGSDDLGILDRVCSVYFCTPSGKQAAMRMMDLQMESGEFTAAALVGDRLLEQYPDLGADRAMVLFRTALAWCYGGEAGKAADRAAALRREFPTATDIVRGIPMNLADALTRELGARPTGMPSPEFGPPIGGILSVARPGNSDIMPGQRLYGIAVNAPTFARPPDAATNAPHFDRLGEGRTLGIIPSVDRGQLFFQDGEHLLAVDLATGAPLRGWLKTWPKGVFTLAALTETSRGHQLSVTLTDRLVLAIMGHPDQQSQDEMRMTGDGPHGNLGIFKGEPTLVCLDRDTGAKLWAAVLSNLPDSAADARTMQMIGSPLVVGPEVLVTARGASSLGDEEKAYVLAFDARTGKNLWCTFIAGHAPLFTAIFDSRSIPAQQAETTTHLAYANGMVYVQSNLGALAALDPWGGQIRWLDLFPIGRTQPKAVTDRSWGEHCPRPFDHKPWTFNPVVVTAGRLFAIPAEGQLLHICDAYTGREIKRVDLARLRRRFPDPGSKEFMPDMRSSSFDTLVGIRGNQLIVSSDRSLCCVDWLRYDPAAREPFAAGVTVWAVLLPTQTRGRPYLTDRELLVPCQDRLYRLDPSTGKTTGAFPSAANVEIWTAPDEPGNILATEQYVVIAGADVVNVYRGQ